MMHVNARVLGLREVAPNILVLSFHAPGMAERVAPGQFVNIRVNDFNVPLLRRPFSVYHVAGDEISILFNVIGLGTTILSRKKSGDLLDVIGPLGRPFGVDAPYSTAVLVAGGVGIAPLPMITAALRDTSKNIVTYLGARTADQLVPTHLLNVKSATEDGSAGYHGTVVDALRSDMMKGKIPSPKIFTCGPHPMLRAVAALAEEFNVPCEASLESSMACGIGICQGCPVEMANGEKKYSLICREGTVYDTRTILFA
jgi:dihydroorotate dehydrogenase electron transfer subunit